MTTHAQLVKAGAKWLRTIGDHKYRCQLVCTEFEASNEGNEIPDVIGWSQHDSVLIECKTSRADFHRDFKKRTRKGIAVGFGTYRWYFAPCGLLDPNEMPQGWGLLVLQGKGIQMASLPTRCYDERFEIAHAERGLLLSINRRLRANTAIYIQVENE